MKNSSRRRARRNPASSVLESLGRSLKGVYRAWEPLPDSGGESFALSRFTTVEKHEQDRVAREPERHILISDYLIFSDYSGSDVERSNVRVFRERHGDKPGVYEIHGGYGTDGVGIRLDVADEEILEDLEALESYPVLDDDDMSAMSNDLAEEAAESYGYKDFEREINKQFGVTVVEESDEKLRNLFWEATQDLPEPYIIETGGSVYFDVARMVRELPDDALDSHGIAYEEH